MTGDLLLALLGPTASGKTEASLSLAEELGAEIVCVDSMLVYRGMDVGTAKPTIEQRARVPHHLLDLADPTERFSVARFQALARQAVSDIRDRGHRALLVGGGGLYYRAVVDGLRFPGTLPSARSSLEKEAARVGPEALHRQLAEVDPVAARRIHPRNVRRTIRALEVRAITGAVFSAGYQDWDRYPSDAVRAAGIELPREVLHARIERRVREIMPGLLRETSRLLARGAGPFITSSQAIGYAEAASLLEGRMTEAEASASTVRRTKALARRQMAWLRRDPRIRWFIAGDGGAGEVVEHVVVWLGAGSRLAAAAATRQEG